MAADTKTTIAAAKARYQTLFAKGKTPPWGTPAGNPKNLADGQIVTRDVLPGGWGTAVVLKRGQCLRLAPRASSQGAAVLLFNANDSSERLNPGDTAKIQWTARLGKGRLLFSDMGRVLASITDDTFGGSDVLAGGSSQATNIANYKDRTLRNTRDNFILLASKHGLSKSDIGPCITFFAPISVDAMGKLQWTGPGAKAGDYVDLRAEMNLLAFVSTAPHPLAPGAYEPDKLDIIVWQPAAAGTDDYCRTATEEARRGFENTDTLFTVTS